MTVVLERPYQFVPPVRNAFWPWAIQRLRLYDLYLRKKEGVVDYELRGLDHLRKSTDAGDGILLAPNHCRYADPLVMGWPARELGIHVHAMASWHLFNEGGFDAFALRRMGAFSIFREGNDRQSLETAIDILVQAERPLIVFPEGTTNRTNDALKPLLDGVAFIARTAAKRRKKMQPDGDPKVVIHPVGIKYLCLEPIDRWAHEQLDAFEAQLGWQRLPARDLRKRTVQLAEALLVLKEIQYYGHSVGGALPQRRDALIEHVLSTTEAEMEVTPPNSDIRERVREIRSTASSRYFAQHPDPALAERMRRHVQAADLAQDLSSYPDHYLTETDATDTRIVESIQRMQETFFGHADHSIHLKSVIQFAPAIEVATDRPPRGQRDPLMKSLDEQLHSMIGRLATEARPL